MRKDLAPVVAVHLDDIAHGSADGERAADDGAGAGARDQIEAFAEIEAFLAARAGELDDETVEECGGIDAAHATAVQAQHPEGFDVGRSFRPGPLGTCNHARPYASRS